MHMYVYDLLTYLLISSSIKRTFNDWKRLNSFHVRCQWCILHISWHDFVSNDGVLRRTGLLEVSFIVRKQRLGLFGHVARLSHTVPADQIFRICTKAH